MNHWTWCRVNELIRKNVNSERIFGALRFYSLLEYRLYTEDITSSSSKRLKKRINMNLPGVKK